MRICRGSTSIDSHLSDGRVEIQKEGELKLIEKVFYFAYGSNMNHAQMNKRCPSSKFIKPGYLNNYKFIYDGQSKRWDKKAVANVVYSDGCQVWGGLFEINEDNLAALDCYEGYPASYDKEMLEVQDTDGNKHKAWVYLRTGEKPGTPSEKYRRKVKDGAKDCGLSCDYIEKNIIFFLGNRTSYTKE